MINIRDVEILDILPFTFKTSPENIALSYALKRIRQLFYDQMSSVLFWADIENAAPWLLDLMAAEVDAPFYSTDMSIEQKRSSIAAAWRYNRTLGTVESVEKMLAAAFGDGDVIEWFKYGGKDFYFKLEIGSTSNTPLTPQGYELLRKHLDKVKPKRAKLEEATFYRDIENNLYVKSAYVPTYKRFTIKAAELPAERSGNHG